MRSLASIGKHPLHPVLITLPLGAFAVSLFADLFVALGLSFTWAETARHALMIGIAGGVLAAVAGLIDYVSVKMSPSAKRIATFHMVINLVAVFVFLLSFAMRTGSETGWSALAFAVSGVAFAGLLTGGWLGGELVFKHKVAVVEYADPVATEIGRREEREARSRDDEAAHLVPEPHRR
jgi:uncharacterized membrane protein